MYRKKIDIVEEVGYKSTRGFYNRKVAKKSIVWEPVHHHKKISVSWYKDIILEFRFVRIKEHLTQAQLGKLVGSHQPWISAFENGRINPSFEFMTRVAKALKKKIILHLE